MSARLPLGLTWPESNLIPPRFDDLKTFHAYVHIPFCEFRCGYCDFNTYTAKEIGGLSQSSFHESLITEIDASAKILENSGYQKRSLSTLFFGGGTPSLFTSNQIEQIITSLKGHYGFLPDIEITLEANPESASPKYLEQLAAVGVNRISLGVQSFDPKVLATLERVHDPDKVGPILKAATELGLESSLDLIYGAPNESLDSWRKTVEIAASMGTGHVSAYSLIVEPGTKLARQIKVGELPETDDDLDAEKFEIADRVFQANGLPWYEVANWGKPSKHNHAYWGSADWWGFGPGAHSHLSGNRFWNTKHPLSYQKQLANGSPVAGIEYIDARTNLEERLMLELRTSTGIPLKVLAELGIIKSTIDPFVLDGSLKIENENLAVTAAGRLFVDRIVLQLLTN
ncbi:MAG: radical SAM family heme chaperone HemW [Actinomycetales bacterium]